MPSVARTPAFGGMAGRKAGIIGAVLLSAMLISALLAPLLATADPFAIIGPSLAAPSLDYLMGTDALGRDLFSGVLYGTRTSLLIATAVGLLATACGVTIGITAGYLGGSADDLLMRITELFQVLPRFILVAVIIALLGPGLDRVVLTLGLTSWPVLARVVRGEVLATRNLDFVLSAEALGATRVRIFSRVLLPQVMPSVLVLVALMLGQVLLLEASLGFLGLGDPNNLTWGMLAGQAQGYLRAAWWLPLFPGLAITLTVLGFNLFADGLSAALQRR
ncbi:MAG: ABC transporter permease [Gemmatimonadaceae bacterium]|nr:ABC transporter permease [Gemmatimonadaceae bacterium]MDQ3520146.1 ABC transporter permease [Gemmatimonadota bacterium]